MWMKPPIVYELTRPRAHSIAVLLGPPRDGPGMAVADSVPPKGVKPSAGSAAGGERVLEDRDLRVRLGDLAAQRHADQVGEREDLALEDLVVVGGQGIRREIGGDETVADLVEVRV